MRGLAQNRAQRSRRRLNIYTVAGVTRELAAHGARLLGVSNAVPRRVTLMAGRWTAYVVYARTEQTLGAARHALADIGGVGVYPEGGDLLSLWGKRFCTRCHGIGELDCRGCGGALVEDM